MATATRVKGPDGLAAISIECRRDESYCLREAQRACPQGYLVIDAGARAGDVVFVHSQGAALATRYEARMIIRCQ